ncbi:MAG: GNAT family N-acetyltransferase [Proteobacteria bacterium]|nr:GNAT family N-acetyltransferase [Pseudomonadota bacterium]
MAFAIRSAVFMAEQACPYPEEFDGNDYCATHVVGFVDDEPAATMRIRYFAGFAKPERLAVLPRFRGTHVARKVIETGVEICRRKGYTRLYGHSQIRLLDFWAQYGFKPLPKNAPLIFSDHEYVEIAADIEPHEAPITMMSGAYVILRPEGKWDDTGVLDRSAIRPVTNPH